MASDVQICNLALSKIGEASIISLTEDSEPGRQCNLLFAPIRDSVLRAFPWNFATRRVALAQTTNTPVFGFSFEYSLPADYLKVIEMDPSADSIKFQVEYGFLLTDEQSVSIRYISQITDPNKFDSMFVEVLSARLAAELCVPLTDNVSLAEQLFVVYNKKLDESRTVNSQEGTPEDLIVDDFIQARL